MNPISDRPGGGGWYRIPGYWLIITLLALPVVSPLLRLTSVPCTHDGHLHYHRIAAMRYAWENGLLFSRWLPDVAFGYGYPFFNYREAIPLYLSLLPHLVGVPLPGAINLFYIVSLILAGWFMFLWVRDLFGSSAALVSAVAYLAAPYLLMDALVRGNQPESLALALFPLLGWAGRRFLIGGRPAYFLISALSLAILALGHNISILIFTPFLFIYLLFVGWWRQIPWQKLALRLVLLFGFGLALSLFYLAPALFELDEITIVQSVNRRGNDFRFNFASFSEIFAPVQSANSSLINPPLLIRLGLIPTILAALGMISIFWIRQREQRGHIIFMALATIFFLFMSLAASSFIWEGLPLIEFVQFPWRFIGRAALPLAFLAGVPFAMLILLPWRQSRMLRWMPFVVLAGVVLILLEAMPMLYPARCQEAPWPTINKVHAYEHNTGLVGVDPEGSYFPKSVAEKPKGSELEENYLGGQIPQRFDSSQLPSGATINEEHYKPLSAKIDLTSPIAFQARYLTFSFPGWKAFVDGRPVPIMPSDPEGLITFTVPAGQHLIEVRWQMTTVRLIATMMSVAALIGMIICAVLLGQYQAPITNDIYIVQQETNVGKGLSIRFSLGLLLVAALAFLALKFIFIDRGNTPIRRISPPTVDYSLVLKAGEMEFAGFNLSEEAIPSGSAFDVDLAWSVAKPPLADYQSNVWLVGPNGLTWSDKETARPRVYEDTVPTRQWLPGQWAWDSREVRVLPGTPPGTYDIVLILFNLEDLQPLTLVSPDGIVLGPSAVIGQIEVVRPAKPADFSPQYALEKAVAGLMLLGYNQDRTEAAPGEQIQLSFFWQKGEEVSEFSSQDITLELFDEANNLVHTWLLSPVRSDYPPSNWQIEERVLGQHLLRLPPDLQTGKHQFRLEGLPLGSVNISAPERLLSEPSYTTSVGADFSGLAELVGLTIEPEDPENKTSLTVSLVWQGLTEIAENYRVFVHLLDKEGNILDQSDAEPANWTRPTPGWIAGEYILDRHQLILPAEIDPAELNLRIGLYDSLTATRLPVEGGDSIYLSLP